MINNLKELKNFLVWAQEHNVRAVKFTDNDPIRPVDVVFDGGPIQAAADAGIPHHPYVSDEEEGGGEPSEEDLYGGSG